MNVYARAARNAKVLALAEALRRLYARCTDPKPPISEFAAGFDRELRHRLAVIADVYPPSDATWDELVAHLERCEASRETAARPSRSRTSGGCAT